MKVLISSTKQQGGAALAIGLIVLLMMTVLGISSMQSTIDEDKMSFNMNDRSLAFQAAEEALKEAEGIVKAFDGTTAFYDDSVEHYYGKDEDVENLIKVSNDVDSIWKTDKSKEVTLKNEKLSKISQKPRYIIQHLYLKISDIAGLNIKNYKKDNMGGDLNYFKVFVLGVGSSPDTRVMLEAHYAFEL